MCFDFLIFIYYPTTTFFLFNTHALIKVTINPTGRISM